MTARLTVDGGRVTWTSCPPVVLRRTGSRRVHVVAVGGGPLGGDSLGLEVTVGPDEHLELRGAAATVVQPGREPGSVARFRVSVRVGARGSLVWRPEPTVVTDGAVWEAGLRLELAAGAEATVAEQVVLGRDGQRGGRVRSSLDVVVDGHPLLVTENVLDGADPALAGPGGTGGHRSLGTVLRAGHPAPAAEDAGETPELVWARTPLAGPGDLLTVLGAPRAVADLLAREAACSAPVRPAREPRASP